MSKDVEFTGDEFEHWKDWWCLNTSVLVNKTATPPSSTLLHDWITQKCMDWKQLIHRCKCGTFKILWSGIFVVEHGEAIANNGGKIEILVEV